MRATLAVVRRCVAAAQITAQLNLIVVGEDELVAVRYAIGAPAPSLYVKQAASGLFVASEPLDDEPGDMLVSSRGGSAPVEWARVEQR